MRFEVRSKVPIRDSEISLPVPRKLVSSSEKLVLFSPPERLKLALPSSVQTSRVVTSTSTLPSSRRMGRTSTSYR